MIAYRFQLFYTVRKITTDELLQKSMMQWSVQVKKNNIKNLILQPIHH